MNLQYICIVFHLKYIQSAVDYCVALYITIIISIFM